MEFAFSLQQLAVLGACMCRGNNPEPCKCARIAAILTKETGCLKDEVLYIIPCLSNQLQRSEIPSNCSDNHITLCNPPIPISSSLLGNAIG